MMRKTIEAIYGTYNGPRSGKDWEDFKTYCGRFWFSNGNHHHYGNEKFIPACSPDYFESLLKACDQKKLPIQGNTSLKAFWKHVKPIFYDLSVEPKEVDQRSGIDNIVNSSNNFYEGVTEKEVENFYSKFDTKGDAPSWGLNSKLIKDNGQIQERVWKSGGMYGSAIQKIIDWARARGHSS